MTQASHVLPGMRRAVLFLLLAVSMPGFDRAALADSQADTVNPRAAGMYEFQQRLTAYLKLREELSQRLKPLSPTASAAELTARQGALAAALRAARKNARPGDLIPPAVADQIVTVCMEDFHFRNPEVKRAALQEVPNAQRPVINRTYPEQEALATVPPLLLSKLPGLPDNLQYRFFGRHMVILDGDTQIIIDYVANVVPPRR
jgi:hypothetical protein